ncbi:TetR family transcriptional regulator [uncultured Jatrophihabitans sp.]|uniref:TetR family transcriptional regulator n=1 Tax=uncultured Jatrophihabitans sp. TaxID=1610747 RepID=UPI0035C955A4
MATGRGRAERTSVHDADDAGSVSEAGSRAERKEQTRRRLLAVTLKLIEQRSLASLSLREVAREAGIVPTAFYRHFASIDELGVELVDEAMRPLRQMIREARRGQAAHGDIIVDTVAILARQVRAHPNQFRFLTRERYGGVAGVRRGIATELRLFTSDLTVDLSRLTVGLDWTSDDLEMAAGLMVAAMLGTVMELLEVDDRHPEDAEFVLDRAQRQLRLIVLGMGEWRSKP